MSVGLSQEHHVRAIFHRFRACSDAHRDRYHDECAVCVLIESNDDRCIDTTHIRDTAGRCMTCVLLDARLAGVSKADENQILRILRKLARRD